VTSFIPRCLAAFSLARQRHSGTYAFGSHGPGRCRRIAGVRVRCPVDRSRGQISQASRTAISDDTGARLCAARSVVPTPANFAARPGNRMVRRPSRKLDTPATRPPVSGTARWGSATHAPGCSRRWMGQGRPQAQICSSHAPCGGDGPGSVHRHIRFRIELTCACASVKSACASTMKKATFVLCGAPCGGTDSPSPKSAPRSCASDAFRSRSPPQRLTALELSDSGGAA
jgi:hypothetical protein